MSARARPLPASPPKRKLLPLLLRPRAVGRFLLARDASLWPKLGLVLAIIYAISPVDLVPDLAPLLGWLDDAGFLALAFSWLGREVERFEEGRRGDAPEPVVGEP
ncbi:MAG: DUF1232 domain-containing protein [Deltaproteobacteria bacterium]|nr:DUF1232 domain-containing protein [Deltaproteobacteria bacterium]